MELLQTFFHNAANASLGFWLVLIPLVIVIWFIPSFLALFFNRKHLKLIFFANIPAGFSFIAWGACILWALSGKMNDKMLAKYGYKSKPKESERGAE